MVWGNGTRYREVETGGDPAMLIVRATVADTELTGTIYERGEDPPRFRGCPDDDAPYVWICDEFYEVDTGGCAQAVGDREVRIAFESPLPRGFNTREQALSAAKDHLRTQFARIGVGVEEVTIEIRREPAGVRSSD